MKNKKVLLFLLLVLFPALTARAAWVWSPESGKFVNPEGIAQGTAEEDFDYAMKFYREKNFKVAAEKFQQILKKYPAAKVAPEAYYYLGMIYEETGDPLKAFKTYKTLIESYPQSDRFSEVIEREFNIGNLFLSGKKAKIAGLEILPSLPRAVEVFEHIVKAAPYSQYGDQAQFQLGLANKKSKHYAESVAAFQALIDQYPKSELVDKARFQLTETSFLRSSAEYRDQRALDEASKQVDKFMTRYPGTEHEASEEAAKLRQAIDEKNSEKNYRVGLYYEKEKYLESAFIYYSDVAKKYPDTKWGQKAAERLKSLKNPADYLSAQEKQAAQEIAAAEAEFKSLPASETLERDQVKRKIERLQKHAKTVQKSKKESIETRREDLNRRQRELKIKFKNLDVKKKLMQKNPSEDFKRAMDRWYASLITEQEQLTKEKAQIGEWQEELGIPKSPLQALPFFGEGPTALEKVRAIEAKKLFKLSEEKKALLENKEVLYKHHGEVRSLLKQYDSAGVSGLSEIPGASPELAGSQKRLRAAETEITRLHQELEAKTSLYEKLYGKSGWLSPLKNVSSQLISGSKGVVTKSVEIINPFDHNEKLETKSRDELVEAQMHVKEKASAQQNLVDTLTQAFDAQLAFRERQRLLEGLETGGKTDLATLRKEIKAQERKIRSAYEEIEDRHKRQKQLVSELDSLLKSGGDGSTSGTRSGRKILAPVTGTARMFKAFFVGLPHEEVVVTQNAAKASAKSPENEKVEDLRKQVELESLVIEAKNTEIVNWKRDLEILKAKASLQGGYKVRPLLVKVPYTFVGEAIDSAKRIIPRKNREEILINRLNEETQRLEAMKSQLTAIDKAILTQEGAPQPTPVVPAAPQEKKTPAAKTESLGADQEILRKEIEALAKNIEIQESSYVQEKSILKNELEAKNIPAGFAGLDPNDKEAKKRFKKLQKELKEIEDELSGLIRKEGKLEGEESSILEKRIQKIDQVVKKTSSKSLSKDLLTERSRMEERFSELQSRRDFLSKELKRFEFAEAGASRS